MATSNGLYGAVGVLYEYVRSSMIASGTICFFRIKVTELLIPVGLYTSCRALHAVLAWV